MMPPPFSPTTFSSLVQAAADVRSQLLSEYEAIGPHAKESDSGIIYATIVEYQAICFTGMLEALNHENVISPTHIRQHCIGVTHC